ncbi:MAG: hypothetical protein ACOC6R_00460 [Chloroflexota bacterium]
MAELVQIDGDTVGAGPDLSGSGNPQSSQPRLLRRLQLLAKTRGGVIASQRRGNLTAKLQFAIVGLRNLA